MKTLYQNKRVKCPYDSKILNFQTIEDIPRNYDILDCVTHNQLLAKKLEEAKKDTNN
jgi:hypothetical protein